MVNIEYTDVNGNRTKFGSRSADDAMRRLNGIRSYRGTVMDSAAANLASGFAARHKNLERVRENSSTQQGHFNGIPGGLYASDRGPAARVRGVADISVSGGKLDITTQDRFVSTSGSVIGTSTRRHDTVANIVTPEEVRQAAAAEAEKAAAALERRLAAQESARQSSRVVITDIDFSVASGPLVITVKKALIGANGTQEGGETETRFTIGTEVMIHESMSSQKHSKAFVLSRQSDVHPMEHPDAGTGE